MLISCSQFFMQFFFSLMYDWGINFNVTQTFIYCFLFFSVTPYIFGCIVSIASRYLEHFANNCTGKVMAMDTIGSVLGSLVTTLLLMPFIGVNNTITLLVVFSCLCYAVLSRRFRFYKISIIIITALFANHNIVLEQMFGIVKNNAISTIVVRENQGDKFFIVNNSFSSKYTEDKNNRFDYVRYIEDNFIATIPTDKKYKILILGAGGFTMGKDDTFHDYTFVDVDKDLLKVSEERLFENKLPENKKYIVQDAMQFLKTDEKYDLIIMDTYSGIMDIPFHLLSKEYFELIKSRLAKKGIIVMNIIASASFDNRFSLVIDNTLQAVFPNLHRQVLNDINPWDPSKSARNVIYIYYDKENYTDEIYTNDKNRSFYDNY